MLVQLLVVDIGNEHGVVIEKMHLLLVAHGDVRMPAQEIMQRRRAGFLRTGQNEIEPVNFAALSSKHRGNVHREACRGS